MRIGERIAERRRELGLSQTRLAREAGLSQGTIGKLEAGLSSGSSRLHRIAAVLRTTPAYLSGDTNNPDEGAPPPSPQPALFHVMMPVALPSENALARMFEGLLEVVDRSAPTDVLARELAQLLPTGLTQLKGQLTELAPASPPRREEVARALANADREQR